MSALLVRFFGVSGGEDHKKEKGLIYWDGEKFECSRNLEHLLDEPMRIGPGENVSARSDPVGFMEALQINFRSPYFWAEAPETLPGSR